MIYAINDQMRFSLLNIRKGTLFMPTFHGQKFLSMKNWFICLLVALLIYPDVFSQKTMIKFQIGYGIPLLTSYPIQTVINNTATLHSFSLGSGLTAEGGVIHSLRRNLALQLDFSYLSGKQNKIGLSTVTSSSASYYSRFFEVAPMVRIASEGGKLRPYVSVGPVFGVGKFYANITSVSTGGVTTGVQEREYRGSFAFGGKAALGLILERGRSSFYIQMTMVSMRYAPSNSELTTYTTNSINQLSSLTTAQKQTIYSTSIPTNVAPNPNQPTQALQSTYPFDSIGLGVGVMFRL
ncbi:hypothetical protein WSM22_17580 [Cytophagales bacterium WSM2-2]|nr:hypothetical protein WSM22_17580 [Cytophagales bacterium WSM2-2]